MDEQNPLQVCLPLSSHKVIGQTLNRSGRPTVASILKFGPQPKSIVAQMLNKIKANKINNKDQICIRNSVNTGEFSKNDDIDNKITSCTEQDCLLVQSPISCSEIIDKSVMPASRNLTEIMLQPKPVAVDQTAAKLKRKILGNTGILCDEIATALEIGSSSNNKTTKEHGKNNKSHKQFFCDFPKCEYSCKLSSNLIKHKRVHTNEKPYLCEKCCFRSNFVNSLKAHKRTHTTERPYQCKHCNYKCNSSSNLKKHYIHRHAN